LQASASEQETVFRPISPILSKWFPDIKETRASVDRVNVDLYTF